jgi:hypothetical protein
MIFKPSLSFMSGITVNMVFDERKKQISYL